MAANGPGPQRPWRRLLGWVAAVGALLVVFAAYRDPHMVVDLANRLWACF